MSCRLKIALFDFGSTLFYFDGDWQSALEKSARVLADAMLCHVVITGAEKRAALERAQDLPPEQAPVAAILPGAQVHWAE